MKNDQRPEKNAYTILIVVLVINYALYKWKSDIGLIFFGTVTVWFLIFRIGKLLGYFD
jgi:hypothetical protein